jgi:ATP-dependent DNA helicase RecG
MKLSNQPHLLDALAAMNIHTFEDVLLHVPYRYEDFSLTQEKLYHDQQRLVLTGTITTTPTVFRKGKFVTVRFTMRDQHQHLMHIVAFNRPYLAKMIIPLTTVTVVGKYDATRQTVNMLTMIKGEVSKEKTFKPLYRLSGNLELHWFSRLVQKGLSLLPTLSFPQILPNALLTKFGLMEKKQALAIIHQPLNLTDVEEAMKIFKYEEALTFTKTMQAIREENLATIKEQVSPFDTRKLQSLMQQLPYALTEDQHQALNEILQDLKDRKRMYRLLQGDVGSGKTVVAALALYANALRKQQGALMAPTDALAKQHFLTIQQLLKPTGLTMSLLVGSMTSAEKKAIKESLLNGTIDLLIGTHALFSSDTVFFDLGLAVIDEQHRFGVNQRELLKDKGQHADLLMMSATPIPRSLAMTVYADMDISTLMQFPFKERRVQTKILPEGDALIDYVITSALANQKRIYVIAPKIQTSDSGKQSVITLAKAYQQKYPKLVGLLHGQMDQADKDAALEAFSQGHLPILVSTTVVEVGIDVKPATVMIIHDADTFGLASLHQLRGRIGRDGSEALCLLVVQDEQVEGISRLQVLVDSNDGFYIAEQDLALRGPGEILGSRQAGIPGFQYLNIVKDQPIIQEIRALIKNPITP